MCTEVALLNPDYAVKDGVREPATWGNRYYVPEFSP